MGFTVTNTFVNGTLADADEVNANFTDVETAIDGASAAGTPAAIGIVPIGSIVAWHKTFLSVDSGTADTNTVDALEDSGADFIVDGVTSGMVVFNSADNTFAMADVVTATKITLKADVNGGSAVTDIFPLGSEAYSIYATPELPDNWLECNGTSVSDADSPYNGTTTPDLNGTSEATKGFIRGVDASTTDDAVTGQSTHSHSISKQSKQYRANFDASRSEYAPGTTGSTLGNAPTYAEMVWIIRIK
jgi:hypothetical protein